MLKLEFYNWYIGIEVDWFLSQRYQL